MMFEGLNLEASAGDALTRSKFSLVDLHIHLLDQAMFL
jgi:hypothetical protein